MPMTMVSLKLLLAVSGLSLLSSASPLTQRNEDCRQTQVVILGAGTAGITAAQTLNSRSVTDFVIVEYNGDIGGRLESMGFGASGKQYTVELGANWVQGLGTAPGAVNPIWELAQKHNIKNTYSDYSSLLTYDSSGASDYLGLLDEFEEAYSKVELEAGALLSTTLQDSDFRDALRRAGWDPKHDPKKQVIDWWGYDFEYAQEPDDGSHIWSIVNYNNTFYQWSEENNYVLDERGFSAFLRGEASTFLAPDDPRLLLNSIVTAVEYDDNGVTAHIQGGSCIRAKYAINTFSVGVLQQKKVAFKPELPQWKRNSIKKFDMGTYTKIFFQFPADKVFWNTSTQFFLYADPKTRGYFPVWQSLDGPGFHPGSGIIFATVTGDEAYRLEKQSDDKTKADGLEVLRKMFGKDNVPEPIAFAYPRWTSTPWAHGSYSNWPPGVTIEEHQNLRANVGNMYFAGEATSTAYFGFLQGAYYEGQIAANAVAQCLAGNCPVQPRYEVVSASSSTQNLNEAHGWTVDSRSFGSSE